MQLIGGLHNWNNEQEPNLILLILTKTDLLKLKEQLRSSGYSSDDVDQKNAQSEVDRELRNINTCSSFMRYETIMCTFSGVRFLRSVIKDHEASCSIPPSTYRSIDA